MVEHLPYPLASLVLYRGERVYISDIRKETGTYAIVREDGKGAAAWIDHEELQMMYPPATSCDWNKMLTLEATLR